MRIPSLVERDEVPPPPYTPSNPSSPTDSSSPPPARLSLRGGYIRPTLSPNASNFTSAAEYFEERPCTLRSPDEIWDYSITVPADATRESLYSSLLERKFQDRDVRVADWYTFVNFLIPDRPGPLTEKEKQSDLNEDSDERYERIEAVVAEWNEGFFCPRGVRILCDHRPLEAPAYRSLIDLSGHENSLNDASSQSTLAVTPTGIGSYKTAKSGLGNLDRQSHHRHGPHSYKRRSSVASASSSSSSSSSSSFSSCSIGSFSSGEMAGSDFPLVMGTLLSLRDDPNRKANLKASIRHIAKDLRTQHRALPRLERKQFSREIKTELHTQKKAIKTEIKSLIKEARATHKLEKKARKAGRKAEREAHRVGRKERKCHRRNQRRDEKSCYHNGVAAVGVDGEFNERGVAALKYEAKVRAMESKFHARAKTHEAQAWAYEREMSAMELALEREMKGMDLAAEREARAGQSRGFAFGTNAGLQGRGNTTSMQETGVVEKDEEREKEKA